MITPSRHDRLFRTTDRSHRIDTPELYKPLQETIEKSIYSVNKKRQAEDSVESRSILKDRIRSFSKDEAEVIKQKTNLFRPRYKDLIQTNDYNKIRNRKFRVVDIQQIVYDEPIKQEEFEKIPKYTTQQIIVYEFKNNPVEESEMVQSQYITRIQNTTEEKDARTNVEKQHPVQNTQEAHTHTNIQQSPVNSQPYEFKTIKSSKANPRKKQRSDYKYNLYNCIDQLVNKGCGQGSLGCFSNNEICAQKIREDDWSIQR